MASTLLLNPTTWDLLTDASGNIAMATEPYAIAQDVATACRLYLGELWYDTTQGVDYPNILNHMPPDVVVRTALETAALTVPLVVQATCVLTSFTNRTLTAQIQIVDSNGGIFTVAIP